MHVDIAIIGGGITGLIVAGLLKDSGLEIAIVDCQSPPSLLCANASYRAVNYASMQVLKKLGLWSQLEVVGYQRMYVWEHDNSAICFQGDHYGMAALGYIVNQQVLHYKLYHQVVTQTEVSVFNEVEPKRLVRLENEVQIDCYHNHSITAKLVIGADGCHSWVREQLGIAGKWHNYHQKAVVSEVMTAKPHQQTAWQRFLPQGSLAFLPLSNDYRCSIVWSNHHALADDLCVMAPKRFEQQLTKAFDSRLGDVKVITERLSFPLYLYHARRYVESNIALLGDAAHVIHPLAGLGLNLAIADAYCLSQVLLVALKRLAFIGALSVLRGYERERRGQNAKTLLFVDQLQRLFTSRHNLLAKLRGNGLAMVNSMPMVKDYFVNQAMGKI